MKTEFEITFRVTVDHPKSHPIIDENSVKCAANAATHILHNCNQYTCVGDDDINPDNVHVKVVGLKENKRPRRLNSFGTQTVPWGEE